MPLDLSPIYWIPAALAFYLVVSTVTRSLLRGRKASSLHCQPVPAWPRPAWDLLGLKHLRKAQAADRSQAILTHVQWLYATMKDIHRRPVMTFRMNLLGDEVFFTSDPQNIQAILAKQFQDFALGETRRGNFFPLLGNGIFTLDGKGWEHSRAMLRPSFARDQVSDLDLEERHCASLLRALKVTPSGWTDETDMQVLFFRLTLDSSTEFLFGESVNSQFNELPENANNQIGKDPSRNEKNFTRAFDTAQDYLSKRGRLGKRYWLINNAEFRRSCKDCHAFIDHYVRLALQRRANAAPEKPNVKESEKYVFLDELVQQTQDPIELRSQLLNILLAGRDTTASLLGWTFYLLARHPAIFQKLRQAVLDTFGSYGSPRNLSFTSLKSCHELQHTLQEVLRLFPVVPLNARMAIKDTTLPRGGGPDGQSPVFVPKGTNVEYDIYTTQRNPELWGADAAEFKPERWTSRRPGWEHLPFNGGPRICLGQQFALTSASYCVVRMLQRFDKIENLDTGSVLQKETLTMCSGSGVKVRLHEAA